MYGTIPPGVRSSSLVQGNPANVTPRARSSTNFTVGQGRITDDEVLPKNNFVAAGADLCSLAACRTDPYPSCLGKLL
jgi:hypothetical protein